MGWHAHELPHKSGKWKLWTRGGTDGVYIKKDRSDDKIDISSDILRMLVAEDLKSELINKIENMDTDEILNRVLKL